jgi:hypothetical protein
MKKILVLILVLGLFITSSYANRFPTLIGGRSEDGTTLLAPVRLKDTGDTDSETGDKIYSLMTHITGVSGGGISIDSASISVDTAGLAGYTQIENLKSVVDEINDTNIFVRILDNLEFVYGTVGTDSKAISINKVSETIIYKGDTYIQTLNYVSSSDESNGKIESITYTK